MATIREELHALIDELSDEELKTWLLELRKDPESIPSTLAKWIEKSSQLRTEISAKYGNLPSVVDTLHEIREERLNDLMGGE